ncbi:MAG: extracellular solute-binding protein [Candidatus Tectimicrobiota bacterium]
MISLAWGRHLHRVAFECLLLLAVATLAAPSRPCAEAPQHGLALGAPVKYPVGFAHFAYADPAALPGGTLTLAAQGGFDKLNPFSLKGRAPLLLSDLVFESLTVSSLDEPFAVYGLLAERIEAADDGLSVTYRLNPRARFADGVPVTAADVVFSYTVLRSEVALPTYRAYYHDVVSVEALDRLTVRLGFSRANRELQLITGQLPILPRHVYDGKDFGRDFLSLALGSGPYRVQQVDFGKRIQYQRHPEYWGRQLNVNVGKYNFESIVVKYYRETTVMLEGLKAGEFDFMEVRNSKQWARDVGGDKWQRGYLVKRLLPHQNTAGMQGFAFNLRRPLFRQRQVRQALALAFDFDWMNSSLFYKQYTPQTSFFDNSELAARGLPSAAELALLNSWRAQLPPAVFSQPMDGSGPAYTSLRQRLRAAQRLLQEAGWEVRHGVLTETTTGQPLRFTITLDQPDWQRLVEPYIDNLRKLGIQAAMKVVDDSIYERLLRTYDFDVVVAVFAQSQSPGNEQRSYWHSEAADEEGSGNLIGIRNPAVDALVEAIITAPTRAALVTAVQALDRVLWHEHYVVPHWYIAQHRVTYWNTFQSPRTLPLYYEPLQEVLYWWLDPDKARALAAARAAQRPLVSR